MTDIASFEREFGRPAEGTSPAPVIVPAKIPVGQLVTSLVGAGPIPWTKVVKTGAMVSESNRLHAASDVAALTQAEQVTRAPVIRGAIAGLVKTLKARIEPQIAQLKQIYAKINLLGDLIQDARTGPLVGAIGEMLSVEEAQDAHDTLRDRATKETNQGSKEHLFPRVRSTAKDIGLIILDFPVFLLAMMGLLNVSMRLLFAGDGPTIILFITAAIFALLGTLLFAVLMRMMGRRHRRFKGADSSISATGMVRNRIVGEQIATVTIAAAVAVVMALRVYMEGIAADSNFILTLALSVLFASLIGVSGYVNYMGEYENGSETIDRIQHLSAQLLQRNGILAGLIRDRSVLVEEAGLKLATLMRAIDAANEHALTRVVNSSADKAIKIARSYTGSSVLLPAPMLTSAPIVAVIKQAGELAVHHKTLKPTNTDNTIHEQKN